MRVTWIYTFVLFFIFIFSSWPLLSQRSGGQMPMSNYPFNDQLGKSVEPYDGQRFLPSIEWNPDFNYDEYTLGPGDVLNFHMWGNTTVNAKVYVSLESKLFFPGIGVIDVKGKAIPAINKILNKRVNSLYKNSFATVALHKPRTFQVKLTGAVKKPGSHGGNAMMRLNELLDKSGGLASNASRINIRRTHVDTDEERIFNLQDYLLHSDKSENPFVRPGDSFYVPYSKNYVIIRGGVTRGGKYDFDSDQISLQKVVEDELGGFVDRDRLGGSVVVSRTAEGEPRTLTFESKAFFDPASETNFFNFMLLPGDQVYFPVTGIENPSISDVVYVTGHVHAPQTVPYQPDLTLNAYISTAGGVSARANYSGIIVYKASGERMSIDSKPVIEPGDTIHVPEKTFKFWQDHLTILTTFLTIVTTTIAITR